MRVREASSADLEAVSVMAAELVRFHHALDGERFLVADGMERGYRGWLASEIQKDGAMLYVADGLVESPDTRVGYVYARREGRDWMKLAPEHVALIDLWVEPRMRRRGVADALVGAIVARADAMNARVILETAARNEAARALFAKHGFAPTMIEMMRPRRS